MTAIATQVLDLFIDANIVIVLAYVLWRAAQGLIRRSGARANYPAQLRLLKMVLLCVALSPALAFAATQVGQVLWPSTPTTLSDMAVAAYLRGDLSLGAAQMEALLTARPRGIEAFVSGQSPVLVALLLVFTLGVAVHLAKLAHAAIRLHSLLRGSYVWRRSAAVDLRLSDTATVPFAARGLMRRHVVVPSHLVTRPQDLKFVLAHEFQHLRQGDVEWELGFAMARALFFWNPAFMLWRQAFEHLREVSCDQTVILRQGISPRAYADCLIDFCAKRLDGQGPRVMNVAFVRTGSQAAKRALCARVLALETAPQTLRRCVLMPALVCILALAVAAATASIRSTGDWSQDRLMLSTIVNLERLEAINSGF